MAKTFNIKNDLDKILPLILKKITKEIKLDNFDNEQIKRIQAYTKLLEQINKISKFIEDEPSVELSEQDKRILEGYLKFNTQKVIK
jgi:hypothetical protein